MGKGIAPWDLIGRMENGLEQIMADSLSNMGFPKGLSIKSHKPADTTTRTQGQLTASTSHSQAYLDHGTRELVDIVQGVYQKDIDRFGYRFD